MVSSVFLDKLVDFYSATFDLKRVYQVGEQVFQAYGALHIENSKYVLTSKAKLWEASCHEHVFFSLRDDLSIQTIEDTDRMLRQQIEPEFVRQNSKYPPPNHMYSFLTMVYITEDRVSQQVKDLVKKYRFNKNYLGSIRGYLKTRIVIVSLNEKLVLTNKEGKQLIEIYEKLMTD